jgi:single-strand DNA-binding protein
MNKCIFIGNLGRDNELSYTPNGTAMCKNSIAVSERWKDKNTGEKKERTTWVRFVIWGKRGEIFNQYTGKGSKVCIEGRLQIDKVEKKDGSGGHNYFTSITVEDFEFLTRGKNSGESDGGAALPDATAGATAAGFAPPGTAGLPDAGGWEMPAGDPAPAADLPGATPEPAGADLPGAADATPEAATLPGAEEPVAAAVPDEELPW